MNREIFSKEVVKTREEALNHIDKLLNMYGEAKVEKEANNYYVTSTDGLVSKIEIK